MATADEFTFNYRFNARLGAKPEWKHIDLNSIVTPGEAPTKKYAAEQRGNAGHFAMDDVGVFVEQRAVRRAAAELLVRRS